MLAAGLVLAGACESAPDPLSDSASVGIAAAAADDAMTYFPDTVPACQTCSLTLEPLTVIGRLTDPVLFPRFPEVLRTSRGEYIGATLRFQPPEIVVFDREGQFVRTVGRQGEGPGEFRRVTAIALGADDSLYVGHESLRTSVFDSTGTYVRSLSPMGAFVEGILPMQDALVVNAAERSAELAGIPLHVVDLEGNYLRSFGDLNVMAPYGSTERVFSSGEAGTVWVAEKGNYRLENLDTYGRKLRVIGVAPPASWYTVTHMTREGYLAHMAEAIIIKWSVPVERPTRPEWPPPFRISGIHAPGNGLLFVSLHVAADDWEEVELEYLDLPGEFMHTDGTKEKLHRTIIDAIDVETGEVRARTEVDGLAYLTNDGTLVRVGVTDIGLVYAETYTVRFSP